MSKCIEKHFVVRQLNWNNRHASHIEMHKRTFYSFAEAKLCHGVELWLHAGCGGCWCSIYVFQYKTIINVRISIWISSNWEIEQSQSSKKTTTTTTANANISWLEYIKLVVKPRNSINYLRLTNGFFSECLIRNRRTKQTERIYSIRNMKLKCRSAS